MDEDRREIVDGGIFVRDNQIEQIGSGDDLPQDADEIIDLYGHVVVPGLFDETALSFLSNYVDPSHTLR